MIAAVDPDILDDPIDEVLLEEEDTLEESLRYEITSYGADYDVDGLVKRLRNGHQDSSFSAWLCLAHQAGI